MNFWLVLIVLGVAYLLQVAMGTLQLRDFANTYGALRRRGKVAIGKRKNALSAGAIALFLIDEEGRIVEGRGMSGLTVAARFKELKGFAGMHIRDIGPETVKRIPKGLRLAIINARDNWMVVQEGEIPQDPPGPWTRLTNRFSRKKKSEEKTTTPTPKTHALSVANKGLN